MFTFHMDLRTADEFEDFFMRLRRADVEGKLRRVAREAHDIDPCVRAFDQSDIRNELDGYIDRKGISSAAELLAGFGVEHVDDLAPQQYAAFVMACGSTKQ